ncbi:unnamed protein product, partial [Musa acuminata var. zebrina]
LRSSHLLPTNWSSRSSMRVRASLHASCAACNKKDTFVFAPKRGIVVMESLPLFLLRSL